MKEIHTGAPPAQSPVVSSSLAFDPGYGYTLANLLAVKAPPEPPDFAAFWQQARAEAMVIAPCPELRETGQDVQGRRVFDLRYQSTGGCSIGGWLLIPTEGHIQRGLIVGHGYGGRDAPDLDLPFSRAALLFPCCRGLSRSQKSPISTEARWHVLHDLDKPARYIHRGCVQDTWLAVSVLERLFPWITGHIGYLGISFSGGIGALALPWEPRIRRAHLNVPSFGHHPLRLELPTLGSAASVQSFRRQNGDQVCKTLAYYDAAIAARRIHIPMHCACALRDPFVPPPGQFAIYNALAGPKELFTLECGHGQESHDNQGHQERALRDSLHHFFTQL